LRGAILAWYVEYTLSIVRGMKFFSLLLFSTSASLGKQCDFPKIDGAKLTPEMFYELVLKPGIPVVITNAMHRWKAMQDWSWDSIGDAFGDIPLRVGIGPYPKTSMTFADYAALAKEQHGRGEEVTSVFQYGQVPTSWSLWGHKDICLPYCGYVTEASELIHSNLTIACQLLQKIEIPEFLSGPKSQKNPFIVTHSGFLIGYNNSGIDFHIHHPAINALISGQKEWFMKVKKSVISNFENIQVPNNIPPPSMKYCQLNPSHVVCKADEDQQSVIDGLRENPSVDWDEQQVTFTDTLEEKIKRKLGAFSLDLLGISKGARDEPITEELQADTRVLRCIQNPGEIIVIPDSVQHAVLNRDNVVAMQMQWNSLHYKKQNVRELLARYLIHSIDPTEPDPDDDLTTPLEMRSCDFPVVDGSILTVENFYEQFVKPKRPVLIKNLGADWPAMSAWKWKTLREQFKNMELRVGPGPYPKAEMSIESYLEMLAREPQARHAVFQYGQLPTSRTLFAHNTECMPLISYFHPHSHPIHKDLNIACRLLNQVQIPEFIAGTKQNSANMVTHSGFLFGPSKSGIDFHAHLDAINIVFDGSKHWLMKVPIATFEGFENIELPVELPVSNLCEDLPSAGLCNAQTKQQMNMDNFRNEKNTENFKEYVDNINSGDPQSKYDNNIGTFAVKYLKAQYITENMEDASMLLHCRQDQGTIMYIPYYMQHAVINQGNTVAMQMQWNSAIFHDDAERRTIQKSFKDRLDQIEISLADERIEL